MFKDSLLTGTEVHTCNSWYSGGWCRNKFKAILGYRIRPYLKQANQSTNQSNKGSYIVLIVNLIDSIIFWEMEDYLEYINWCWKSHLHCEWDHSLGMASWVIWSGESKRIMLSFLSPFPAYGCEVTSCFKFLLPLLPCHDYALELCAETIPISLRCFRWVFYYGNKKVSKTSSAESTYNQPLSGITLVFSLYFWQQTAVFLELLASELVD